MPKHHTSQLHPTIVFALFVVINTFSYTILDFPGIPAFDLDDEQTRMAERDHASVAISSLPMSHIAASGLKKDRSLYHLFLV